MNTKTGSLLWQRSGWAPERGGFGSWGEELVGKGRAGPWRQSAGREGTLATRWQQCHIVLGSLPGPGYFFFFF